MFKKIYIHNYKCFQNFEWNLEYEKSLLILGKNGAGKSTLLNTLKIFREIAHHENRLSAFFNKEDFYNKNVPIELGFVLDIEDLEYEYKLSISYPEKFHEPKIEGEKLFVDNKIIYERDYEGTVLLDGVEFIIDWHSVALPTLFQRKTNSKSKEKIETVKQYLVNMLFLAPIPSKISSDTYADGRLLEKDAYNFCSWLNEILNTEPSFYSDLIATLSKIMPDFNKFRFEDYGVFKQLNIVFTKEKAKLELSFDNLSDGEKLFFIFATIITLSKSEDKPFFCFWDEPENYISLSLLQSLIQFFRAKIEFSSNNQLFFTSHNPEIMNVFSNENIYYIYRDSHLSPARIKNMKEEKDSIVNLLKYGGI
jgi:hypothetical protein